MCLSYRLSRSSTILLVTGSANISGQTGRCIPTCVIVVDPVGRANNLSDAGRDVVAGSVVPAAVETRTRTSSSYSKAGVDGYETGFEYEEEDEDERWSLPRGLLVLLPHQSLHRRMLEMMARGLLIGVGDGQQIGLAEQAAG